MRALCPKDTREERGGQWEQRRFGSHCLESQVAPELVPSLKAINLESQPLSEASKSFRIDLAEPSSHSNFITDCSLHPGLTPLSPAQRCCRDKAAVGSVIISLVSAAAALQAPESEPAEMAAA